MSGLEGLSREELAELAVVEHLLDWFVTVRDGVDAGQGGHRNPSSRWFEMHEWWHGGSFPDLERYLALMRRYRLDQVFVGYSLLELRRHVDWWYLDAVRKSVPLTKPVKRHGKTVGWVTVPGKFVVSVVRDRRADVVRARVGARFLLTRFQLEGRRPRLPDELWRIVTGQPEKVA